LQAELAGQVNLDVGSHKNGLTGTSLLECGEELGGGADPVIPAIDDPPIPVAAADGIAGQVGFGATDGRDLGSRGRREHSQQTGQNHNGSSEFQDVHPAIAIGTALGYAPSRNVGRVAEPVPDGVGDGSRVGSETRPT
jgi:hypothetical protein